MLMSTRDLGVTEEVDEECSVRFGVRDHEKAGKILHKYAGMKKEAEVMAQGDVKQAHKSVLKKCGGLPSALAVAGKTIGRIYMRMRRRGGEERKCARDAIVEHQRQLESRSKHGENRVKEGYGDYVGLFTALRASLEVIDRKDAKVEEKGGRSVSELHRGLCVLQKQQWAPVTMLSCLWGVDEDEAENVCEMMEGISVFEIEHRVVNGSMVMGARMHDLIHDYCVMEATS